MNSEQLWKKRGPRPLDEGFLVQSWLTSYMRSREGQAAGALPRTSARTAFWDCHKPVVELLLDAGDVDVMCDPADENSLWAYACTSGDVLHACIVKREAAEALGPELTEAMVRDMLGDRLERACGFTYFPGDLARLRMLPKTWYPASLWLAQHYGHQLARKAAA